jgi:hypothetical protein
MTAQESLLPCPFCGGHPTLTKHHREDMWGLIHRCEVVGAVSFDWGAAERHAARWNRRHPVARTPLSDDDVGLWIVRTLGAASKQGKYSATRNCVPLGAELVPFFLEFARDHGITQEKQG